MTTSDRGPMDQFAAHLDRGWDLVSRGDLAGALLSAEKTVELDAQSPEAHNLMGYVLAAEGRAHEALAVLPLGFLGVFAADTAAVRAGLLPRSYMALRAPLTFAVLVAHIYAAIAARPAEPKAPAEVVA